MDGDYLDYVGWGVTQDEAQDSGKKRTTSIPYNAMDDTFIYAMILIRIFVRETLVVRLFSWTEEGYTLAGVNSFVFAVQGSQPCVGGASGATRIDAYYSWIREYVPEPPPPEPEVTEEDTD